MLLSLNGLRVWHAEAEADRQRRACDLYVQLVSARKIDKELVGQVTAMLWPTFGPTVTTRDGGQRGRAHRCLA